MPTPIRLVDAFASRPFTGNPAAVCVLSEPADEGWMQAVAMEMNQAETAFCWPEGSAWRLRWFTPSLEVELCGHATLATAHTLWETQRADGPIQFATLSGTLECTREGDAIAMDFPALASEPVDSVDDLAAALNTKVMSLYRGPFDWMALVENVEQISPDMTAIAALGGRGVIVTASSSEFDFVSRFFAPGAGVPEDPVTGSAHCALAPYWAARLGKTKLWAYQASRRGGVVEIELLGDRVRLIGKAVTTLEGVLR